MSETEPLPRELADEVIAAAEAAVDAVGFSGERRSGFLRVFRAGIGWPVAQLEVVRGGGDE